MFFSDVTVYGVENSPTQVTINGMPNHFNFNKDHNVNILHSIVKRGLTLENTET